MEDEQDELDFELLEDGEATMIGLLLVVSEQLGVRVSVVGDHLIYEDTANETDVEIITTLANRLKVKLNK